MIIASPLSPAEFAPFGQVIERPADFGRVYFSDALANERAAAKGSLSLLKAQPLVTANLVATRMERHQFSSQSFVPLDASRYLVVVAPHDPYGKPDHTRLRAFVAGGNQGITYAADVWHHPMCVLDRPGQFAIFMWHDGSKGDEEFVDLPAPVTIAFPAASRA